MVLNDAEVNRLKGMFFGLFVGAVTGQLAGALYGYSAIPEEWLEVLAWRTQLEEMFDKLCVRREEP